MTSLALDATAPARSRDARPAASRATLRPALVPGALCLGAFVVYVLICRQNVRTFQTAAYDLGIFHQAMLSWSHFHLPVSSLKNTTEGLPGHYDLLADHFHPILVLLVPTYWIWPHPITLLIDQAALVAASIAPVHAFCRRRMSGVAAAVLCIAYAGSVGVQAAIDFDFHEVAFAPLLIAVALERADARRWRAATGAALLLLCVKEDLGLLLPFLGIVFAIWGARRLGLALGISGIAGFILITDVIMPALGGGVAYAYWTYPAFGPTPVSAAISILTHPLRALGIATASGPKRASLEELFLPYGVLPFFSPVMLLAIPLLAERFLSDRTEMWTDHFQYSLTLMPVLVLSVADSLGTLLPRLPQARLRRLVPLAAALLTLLGTAALTRSDSLPIARLDSHLYLESPARVEALHRALAVLPPRADVAASNPLVVPLLGQDTVRLLDSDDPGTTWIEYETDVSAFVPWQAEGTARARDYVLSVSAMRAAGYRVVYRNAFAVVLTR